MSFRSDNGTRGARQPRAGGITGLVNRIVMNRIRRKDGTVLGIKAAVLTTVGRKSGQPRSTPVGVVAESENSWLIAASAGGAANNPAWYHNMSAHPNQVSIELGKRHIAVRAVQLHGEERSYAWERITDDIAQFAKYERKTDREIPVIRLTRDNR